MLAGHYPLQGILEEYLSPLCAEFPESLLLWGTEVSIAGPELKFAGDHAAYEETSFGLALLPELVEMQALRPGRGTDVWPGGIVPAEGVPEVVCRNPADPLFSQAGADARLATSEHGHEILDPVVARVAQIVNSFLLQQE